MLSIVGSWDSARDNLNLSTCESPSLPAPSDNLNIVRRYLEAIEDGTFPDIAILFTLT